MRRRGGYEGVRGEVRRRRGCEDGLCVMIPCVCVCVCVCQCQWLCVSVCVSVVGLPRPPAKGDEGAGPYCVALYCTVCGAVSYSI